MNKELKRFLSCVITVAMMFTSVFTQVSFADLEEIAEVLDSVEVNEEETEAGEENMETDLADDSEDAAKIDLADALESDAEVDLAAFEWVGGTAPTSLDTYIQYWGSNTVEVDSTQIYEFGNPSIGTIAYQGSEGLAGYAWVDTKSGGKLNNSGRTDNLAQCNDGTVIYVPVNGTADITVNSYNADPTITVEDAEGSVTEENKTAPRTIAFSDGKKVNTITYKGKSTSAVKVTLKGIGYISSISVNSKGVQEETGPTWAGKNLSFKIGDTKVDITGPADETGSAEIKFTGNDETANVVSSSSTSAEININLGDWILSQDMISEVTGGTFTVKGSKIVFTYTDQSIDPLGFTLNINNTWAPKTLEEYIAKWKESPVAVGEVKYSFLEKDIGNIAIEGNPNKGLAGKVWVSTENGGKLNNIGNANWAQCNSGTEIYVPVNGTADIKFKTYNAGTKVIVEDIAEAVPEGTDLISSEKTSSAGQVETTIEYKGKSQSVVKLTFSDAGYIEYVKVDSKGIQQGGDDPKPPVTTDPASLAEYIAKYKADPVTTGSSVSYEFAEDKIGTVELENNKEKKDGLAGELWVSTKNGGKLNNVRNPKDEWAQCGNGTEIYVPVNGTADIKFKVYSPNAMVTVEDIAEAVPDGTKLYSNTQNFPKGNLENVIEYKGKSQSIVKVTFSGAGYISYITVDSKGIQEGEVPDTWVKRNFSLKIKDTVINVTGAENIGTAAGIELTGDNAIVNSKSATEATIKIPLGGEALSDSMITDLKLDGQASQNIEAKVEGNKVIITFKNETIEPLNFTFTVNDSDVIVNAEAGKTYEYDFRNGKIVTPNDGTITTFYTEDGLMVINGGGKLSSHNDSHGITVYGGNSFEIKVAGDADVIFSGCEYGSSDTVIEASVKEDGKGSISPTSKSIKAAGGKDGESTTFSYSGESTTLVFTLTDTSGGWIHKITSKNYKLSDEEGTIDVTGKFVTSDGETVNVPSIKFLRLNDGSLFKGTIADGGYSVKLNPGEYQVIAPTNDPYEMLTHLIVKDGDTTVTKDIEFLSTNAVTAVYAADVYVDQETGENHYATLKDALKVVNAMPGTEKVTIHIAPGTYRAQHILTRANVSLVNTDPTKEVKLTWYYGIGYKYYSADSGGFYNELNAKDKYLKNGDSNGDVGRWGGAFYLRSTATDFYAENIYFENSFNKYVTEEEIADGAEPNGAQSITFKRTKDSDVKSKEATERAAAMLAEADRAEFYKCKFSSSQDTLYINPYLHQYYKDCFIEGMTDYIFGEGEIVFDNCTLNFCGYSDSDAGGYVTATRNAVDVSQGKPDVKGKGYLFNNCTITGSKEDGIKVGTGYLGRPWDAKATVLFFNTVIEDGSLIDNKGFSDWDKTLAKNANYSEYNTVLKDGTAFVTGDASTKLTEEEAKAVNMKDWFGEWTPANYKENGGDDDDDKVEYDPTVKYGDVDGNGIITAADASLVLASVMNSEFTLSDTAMKAANVDGKGLVTANDASLILQYVLNNSNGFPIEKNKPSN